MASRDEKSLANFALIFVSLLAAMLVNCRFLEEPQLPVGFQSTGSGSLEDEYGDIPNVSELSESEKFLRNLDSGTEMTNVADDFNTQGPHGIHVPKYMLELYNNFKSEKWIHSETVRSFSVVNADLHKPRLEIPGDTKTRIHTLTFNLTRLKQGEILDGAELRIHALISRDMHAFMGVDRLVTVLLVNDDPGFTGDPVHEILDSKHLYEKRSAYEVFNVTAAVNFWMQSPPMERRRHILEIRIESVFSGVGEQGTMDISTSPFVETEPLLLVFSSSHNEDSINSEKSPKDLVAHLRRKRSLDLEEEEEESNVIATEVGKIRKNRKRNKNPCRRRPLFVNFSDINYDTWIIAPKGYEAFECSGKCYFPLSDHLTPSQHAIVQTLLHTLAPKKAPRACCVPTKLDSISILYLDSDGVVTYKYRHEDMVVIECGCR